MIDHRAINRTFVLCLHFNAPRISSQQNDNFLLSLVIIFFYECCRTLINNNSFDFIFLFQIVDHPICICFPLTSNLPLHVFTSGHNPTKPPSHIDTHQHSHV